MNPTLRKSLLASAIAALLTTPAWATEPASQDTQSQHMQKKEASTQQESGAQHSQSEYSGSESTSQQTTSEQMGEESTQAAGSSEMAQDNPLLQKTPQELAGKTVVNMNNEEIGTLENVVSSPRDNNIHGVITTGGILGIFGVREVTVPLNELEETTDGESLMIQTTGEELQDREEYQQDQFVEVEPEDQPIGEFTAMK